MSVVAKALLCAWVASQTAHAVVNRAQAPPSVEVNADGSAVSVTRDKPRRVDTATSMEVTVDGATMTLNQRDTEQSIEAVDEEEDEDMDVDENEDAEEVEDDEDDEDAADQPIDDASVADKNATSGSPDEATEASLADQQPGGRGCNRRRSSGKCSTRRRNRGPNGQGNGGGFGAQSNRGGGGNCGRGCNRRRNSGKCSTRRRSNNNRCLQGGNGGGFGAQNNGRQWGGNRFGAQNNGWNGNGFGAQNNGRQWGGGFGMQANGGGGTWTNLGMGYCRGNHAMHNPINWYIKTAWSVGNTLSLCQQQCQMCRPGQQQCAGKNIPAAYHNGCVGIEYAHGTFIQNHCELWIQSPQTTNQMKAGAQTAVCYIYNRGGNVGASPGSSSPPASST